MNWLTIFKLRFLINSCVEMSEGVLCYFLCVTLKEEREFSVEFESVFEIFSRSRTQNGTGV